MASLPQCALVLASAIFVQVDVVVGAQCNASNLPGLAAWFEDAPPALMEIATGSGEGYQDLMTEKMCTHLDALQVARADFNASECELDVHTNGTMQFLDTPVMVCQCSCPDILPTTQFEGVTAGSPECAVLECMVDSCPTLMASDSGASFRFLASICAGVVPGADPAGSCNATDLPGLADWLADAPPLLWAIMNNASMPEDRRSAAYEAESMEKLCTHREALQAAKAVFDPSVCELDTITNSTMMSLDHPGVLCECTCPGLMALGEVDPAAIAAGSPECAALTCAEDNCPAFMSSAEGGEDDMRVYATAAERCGGDPSVGNAALAPGSTWAAAPVVAFAATGCARFSA